MTKIAIQPNASGTGTFTIAAPNSNDNRTFTLPDEAGELLTDQRLASEAEAEVGTDNSKLMTPLRTAQAIAELSPAPSELTQTQAEDPTSTVFGTVSGERLRQSDVVFRDETALGWGQTWQDVIGSRAFNTTYTNNTGRPIFVSISILSGGSGRWNNFVVDGVVLHEIRIGSGFQCGYFVVVPNNNTYRLNQIQGSQSITYWTELR